MKSNKIILAVAVAAAVYLFTRSNPHRFRNAPPPPMDPRQARTQAQIMAVQQWARTIITLFGNVRELWQPGGLFYSIPREILDDVNIRPPAPGSDAGGQWV